ncbi:MAG: thiamine pyrophosphate-dependent enzyme [Thermoproteota archaeon]
MYLEQKEIHEELMLGDEAIARGAVEAGVRFVASYPGTPSTEITTALVEYAKKYKFHVEWSANEKVAFEAAYGASLSGLRALVGTKHLGMNVLSDSLLVAAYGGVRGGLVITCIDDSHPYSSQNAMDSRYYCLLAHIPCLEPSSPNEAKELTKFAFELSEKFSLPVVLRATQRIAHARGLVKTEEINNYDLSITPKFVKDKSRFVLLAKEAYERKKWLFNQMKEIEKELSTFGAEVIYDTGSKLGVVGVGIGAAYAKYVAEELGIEGIKILKLNLSNPLPKRALIDFAEKVDEVLVFEDGDPIVEHAIRNLFAIEDIRKHVRGKDDSIVSSFGELDPDKVSESFVLMGLVKNNIEVFEPRATVTRSGGLCAGCPHMASYYVIKEVLRQRGGGIITGDRGCYNQGAKFPLEALDTCMDMGASIGIAYGISKAGVKEPIIAVIGDSTFFHAGLPALANATYNHAKFTITIFDNGWTSMTGQQPSFSTGLTAVGMPTNRLFPELLAKDLGVSFVEVVDPFDVDRAKEILNKALDHEGVSVVVFRHECALQEERRLRAQGIKRKPYVVDPKKCTGCRLCLTKTGCQALRFSDGKMTIDGELCTACGLCAYVCPFDAISQLGDSL